MQRSISYKVKPSYSFENIVRRAVDILVAISGLILLSPVYVLLGYLIKKDSPGPVFFKGARVGKGGNVFQILKFRTMFEDPESYNGPRVTGQGDPRVTPLGAWLRETKLNELPQLWNVLKGNMSLVGPRPEDPDIIQEWPEDIREILLSVRPGITSPASVIYRDEETLLRTDNIMDDYLISILPSKLRLDSLYVQNRSILTDLDVVFWTLFVLVPRAQNFPVPETKLYWGPLSIFFSHVVRWFFTDLFVSLIGVITVVVIWRSITPLHIGWVWAPLVAFLFAMVFSLTNLVLGTHRTYWVKARPSDAFDLIVSSTVAALALWLLDTFVVSAIDVPDGLFVITGVFVGLGFIGVRYRERILTGAATRWLSLRSGAQTIGEPIIIVGAGELGAFATWLVRQSDIGKAFSILGMVDDDPRKQGMRIDGLRVIGTTNDLPELIRKHRPGLVLFAISSIAKSDHRRIIQYCEEARVRIVMIPDVMSSMRAHFRSEVVTPHQDTNSNQDLISPDFAAELDPIALLISQGETELALEQIAALRKKYTDLEEASLENIHA